MGKALCLFFLACLLKACSAVIWHEPLANLIDSSEKPGDSASERLSNIPEERVTSGSRYDHQLPGVKVVNEYKAGNRSRGPVVKDSRPQNLNNLQEQKISQPQPQLQEVKRYSVERGWYTSPVDPAKDIQQKRDYRDKFQGKPVPYRPR